MSSGSRGHYPGRGGRSRDTEPWAADPWRTDPGRRVLKDALGLARQRTLRLLLDLAGTRSSAQPGSSRRSGTASAPRGRRAGRLPSHGGANGGCLSAPGGTGRAGGNPRGQNSRGRAKEVLEGPEFPSSP